MTEEGIVDFWSLHRCWELGRCSQSPPSGSERVLNQASENLRHCGGPKLCECFPHQFLPLSSFFLQSQINK